MKKQSVKRRRRGDDGSAVTVDRLSQLPQPVLHNILSLLPQQDAARTSVLSKSWRYLWHGRLNVEFRDNWWFFRKKEFWPFVDKTLQRYLDQNLSLHKFLVDINYVVDVVLLQKWIPLVIMNMGVRSLNLLCTFGTIFVLPLVVFQSENLVELRLSYCNFDILKSTNNVMLNNLRTLRLSFVQITDEIFEKIISGCPLIENLDLYLYQCIGLIHLNSIKFHKHHNLKDFRCSGKEQIIIEIEYPHTLESVHTDCRNWFLHHRNMHFPHLKSLELYRVQLPADIFDNFSSFFPCINELILHLCDGLKEFLLLSSSIKRLTIKTDLKNGIKAFIDTPNILYFEFSGDYGFLPSIKFTTTSNEWESKITLWYKLKRSDKDATSWFLKLNKLLKALSQSHITLKLFCKKYNKLHINDSYGGFYKPVVVKCFKLCRCITSGSVPPFDPAILLNCFFRICRPRYIHIDQSANNLVEFICNLIPKEKGSYIWLQDLEEVSIEVWKRIEDGLSWVQATSLPEHPDINLFRFRLTWNEQ
ncbi:hypothetical protein CASFOL_021875 [Castilleja foliolosa]|uniref:F-box domain-containing protein n=1 Tax=Castilleja foliolosa TaxID=1961234 RepID=A0ABD3CXV9_9LAMI